MVFSFSQTYVDKHDFCCFSDDEGCSEDKLKYRNLPPGKTKPGSVFSVDVVSPTIKPPENLTKDITQSGVYLLVFSNCGQKDSIKISGDVVVRNPYGYLPGNDYYKWPFHSLLIGCYSVLIGIWLFRCCLFRKQLFSIHLLIGLVLVTALVEGVLWWDGVGSSGFFTIRVVLFMCGISMLTSSIWINSENLMLDHGRWS